MQDFSLGGKVALVTGASRGIGKAFCLELAKRQCHIIAVARTVGGLEELDDEVQALGGTTTLVPLDLSDMDGIDRLGASIFERWGYLDILLANAGILGPISPVAHIEASEFDKIMAINVTSQWRLIRSTEPLLREAMAGRAILMSSGAAHRVRAFWGAYGASKAALEVLGRAWADEMRQTNLRINLVNPGATRTDMRAKAMPGEDPLTLPTAAEVASSMIPLVAPDLNDHGRLFDVRRNRFVDYHLPD
ncbi:SDR family NAD(P)-dependent oxidoreductase [Bartonella sp. HY761]|uniref:SDR family NAD(P)-dependent oxidoreductase n=1 Tax=Bartonella sp. HY761 TaxID=2979330 RepID=UPI0022065695|nr:SDR family NAD(P)-dependent oxidoreductase [Bartonella sp. HY761]UXN07292.1 SDR family NAD(P)-dependent oxidoreductase [Bartonella sp. HY761]